MKRLIKSKQTWFWIGAITLFALLDIIIFAPDLKQNAQNNAEKLNSHLANYRPIYGGKITKSLFSLRSDYYYQLSLSHTAPEDPTPRNVSDAKFLGYCIPGKTRIQLDVKIDDPVNYPDGKFSEHVTDFNLTLGKKTMTFKGKGSNRDYEIKITVDVKEIDLDIKVQKEGILWNSYSPSKAYYVNLDVKRVKVIEVYKAV